MTLVPRMAHGVFLWDKRTGEVFLERSKSDVAMSEDPTLDLALEDLVDGEMYAVRGMEFGGSIMINDGRWASGRSWAEFKLPCHPTSESYMRAALLAGYLATLFAKWGALELEERVQRLIADDRGTGT